MSKEKPSGRDRTAHDSRVDALVGGVLLRALENVRNGQDLAEGADPWQTAARFRSASQHDLEDKFSRVMTNAHAVHVRKISM